MKKRILILALALVCMLALTGCFCQHEVWLEATCDAPKTCESCGKTEGEALGHVWLAATCDTPRTCDTCGVTSGEAKGHSWAEADCTDPKKCENCGLTEGEALGHDWQEATTETPKTCLRCDLTEGERIITDPRFTTAAASGLFGKWGCIIDVTGEMMDLEGFEGSIPFRFCLEFKNDGTMSVSMQIPDEEAFMDAILDYAAESVYRDLEAQGISRDAADNLFQSQYGMSIQDYLRESMGQMDVAALMDSFLASFTPGAVYYVDGDTLYLGMSWEANMEPTGYTLEGDSLIIDSFNQEFGFDAVFYPVED